MASNIGLNVPNFYMVNNTSQISSLIGMDKKLVSKSVENGVYVTSGNQAYYSYTEEIQKESIPNNVSIMNSLIMDKVEKKFEVRSFFLENKFYSMAIFSQLNKETSVDYRKYSSISPNRCETFQLPIGIEEKLRKLFAHFCLNTGSVDLIVDNNDSYIFLEINPIGQFGMVSQPCNYKLEKTIANYLLNNNNEN